jgi:hypothetical protein
MATSTPSRFLCAAFIIGPLNWASFAGTQISGPKPAEPPATGALTFGYEGSEDLQTGYADVLQPLFHSPGRAALFYDGRFSYDDDQQEVQSHGLVFRYRVPDRDVILERTFITTLSKARTAISFINSASAGSADRWVDFRANYYLPDQKRETVERISAVTGSADIESGVILIGTRPLVTKGAGFSYQHAQSSLLLRVSPVHFNAAN